MSTRFSLVIGFLTAVYGAGCDSSGGKASPSLSSSDDLGTRTEDTVDSGEGKTDLGKQVMDCDACADGQVCSNGVCTDVPNKCPCPIESYCDLTKATCVAGCTKNEECSDGRWCDTDSRTCLDGCRGDSDCADSEYCGDHICTPGCRSDKDCNRLHADGTCSSHQCKFYCDSGYHSCGEDCVLNTSVTQCGSSCVPCSAPAHAAAVCNAGLCDFTCETYYTKKGAACELTTKTDCYPDTDKDGFGDSAAKHTVPGPTCPAGEIAHTASLKFDCDDSEKNAHPGQTSTFTVGFGPMKNKFDYNCDGKAWPPAAPYCGTAYGGCDSYTGVAEADYYKCGKTVPIYNCIGGGSWTCSLGSANGKTITLACN